MEGIGVDSAADAVELLAHEAIDAEASISVLTVGRKKADLILRDHELHIVYGPSDYEVHVGSNNKKIPVSNNKYLYPIINTCIQ